MTSNTIRPAVPSDFVALRAIFDSWRANSVAVNPSKHGWLVAEIHGAIAGGLLASEFNGWHQGLAGFGHLTESDVVPFASLMCVDEPLRRRGVGSQLMTYWIESAPSWAHVIMPATSDDRASQVAREAFFTHHGFKWMPTDYEELKPWLMMRGSSCKSTLEVS